MTDTEKLPLVALAHQEGMTLDEAWNLVDRVVDDHATVGTRGLSQLVRSAAADIAWSGPVA